LQVEVRRGAESAAVLVEVAQLVHEDQEALAEVEAGAEFDEVAVGVVGAANRRRPVLDAARGARRGEDAEERVGSRAVILERGYQVARGPRRPGLRPLVGRHEAERGGVRVPAGQIAARGGWCEEEGEGGEAAHGPTLAGDGEWGKAPVAVADP